MQQIPEKKEETMSDEVKKEEPTAVTNPDDGSYGGFAMCPRCGFDTRAKMGPVSEEDKKEYIRNLIGGTSYTKEYTMFEGQVAVMFKDLTLVESDKLTQLIQGCLQDPLFLIKATQMKVLLSLVHVKRGENLVVLDRAKIMAVKDYSEALALYQEAFVGFPDGVTSLITTMFNMFSQQLFQIVNGAVDRNF
jgi:hypothetical protein